MKSDIKKVLQDLIKERAAGGDEADSYRLIRHNLTLLGVPLIEMDKGRFLIDVTDVEFFRGLSTFVRLLVNDVIEQCGFGTADIMVRRKVDPHLTPELSNLGLNWVMVYARTDAAENLPWFHKRFAHHMNLVFSAVQTAKWGGVLFPGFFKRSYEEHTPMALLFPFHMLPEEGGNGNLFLVEHNAAGGFLRITIEDASASRLHLKHIPNRVVDNLDRQSYLYDIQLMAEKTRHAILRECEKGLTEYKELPERQLSLFEHLWKGSLADLNAILFRWTVETVQMLILEQADESLMLFCKQLLLIEDPDVLSLLAEGNLVEMTDGSHRVFFDISRRGTCLNISIDEPRKQMTLDYYLDKMPLLKGATELSKDTFKNVRVFLIHHITAEVLGLVKAFQEAGSAFVKTFFVKYAGITPDEYLETMLSLPEDTFSFYGLQMIESRQSIKGNYCLSKQYSSISHLTTLDQFLQNGNLDFLHSMRIAAGHLFFREVIECRKNGSLLILVEDGGYLAPLINRFCLENMTVSDVLSYFRVVDSHIPKKELKLSISEWLKDILPGSVEHTKNGFDANMEVMKEYDRLQLPVYSIAISDLKRGSEARECGVAIINAIENILHRLGLVFSQRRVLILGSRGAIGSGMMTDLSRRLGSGNVFGVDIVASGDNEHGCTEVRTIEELKNEILYETDLVIGVVGKSIIKDDLFKKIILNGRKRDIFFASGSTKTVEFEDLGNWLYGLSMEESPRIAGRPVRIINKPIRDLQTGIIQGTRVTITFDDKDVPDKNIYLLAGMTPINFLYYGIPREAIDGVMSQLLRVSIGLIKHYKSGEILPSRLLAVDHDIDTDANLIKIT